MNATLVQVEDLCIHTVPNAGAHFGRALLQACSFSLRAGERLTLVGESGAGKSLLAQAIMGTLPRALKARGSILIKGQATHGQRVATQPHWGCDVMMLPQEPGSALSSLMRMQAQVAEAAHFARSVPWRAARQIATEQLEALGVNHAAQQWLHQISGGMAQRVSVACVGAAQAQLLIADEPTKGLDPMASKQVAAMLMAGQSQGQALLTITHDLDLAAQLGGQLMVLRQGRVVEEGDTQKVLSNPQNSYTQALIAAQPKHWSVYPFEPRAVDADPLIEVRQLSHRFGGGTVFEDLSVALVPGEVLAISGSSGCGKTTLGNVMLGLIQPTAGTVHRATGLPSWKFQKLYQDPPAAFSPFQTLGQGLQAVCKLHRLSNAGQAHWMQALGLSKDLLQRLPSEVSGGELQRFALLRLMQLQPAFIFADEPTSRLDPITQRNTMQVLCEAAAQQGCAVLLVSHDAHLGRASSHRHVPMSALCAPQTTL